MIEPSSRDRSAGRPRITWSGSLALVLLIVAWTLYSYRSSIAVLWLYLNLAQPVAIGDAGLLSDVPCAAPCVFGMEPGRTPLDRVPGALDANGIRISQCFVEPSVSWILYGCGMGRFQVQVNAQTRIVNAIWFHPDPSISLGAILGKYGKPDYVSVSQESLAQGSTIQLYILWDSKRMSIMLPKIDGDVYGIDQATNIESAGFSDEELYQDTSEVQFGAAYKPWRGYGAYRP